jgi:YD repeat-containing protein
LTTGKTTERAKRAIAPNLRIFPEDGCRRASRALPVKPTVKNQLSQFMFETRTFNGFGTFTLSYDYNPAGELKQITDATNMTINYSYDSTGRLNGVTGADNLFMGISNYASNFQNRAWSGLKAMPDGSNHTSSLLYNSKLQPTQFDIRLRVRKRSLVAGCAGVEGGFE